MSVDTPRAFLIVRLGSLGDVVHAIPAAAALRERYPQARIDWLVDPRYVELLGLVTGLTHIVPLDPRASKASLIATLRRLRAVGYDAVIDLQGLVKSAVLARLAGGGRTIGFPPAHLREPFARWFYTERADPGPAMHVMDKNVGMLASVGAAAARVPFPLDVAPTPASSAVGSSLAGAPFALINPGAAWPNKRWPPVRFGAVAAALREGVGLRSVVLWGPGEEALAREVVATSQGAAMASPPTSMRDLAALAREARLMISGDTGPLHVAAAAGTPIVALFGPTLPARNGPWDPADIALSRVEQCVCVYERTCRRAEPCIDDISVAEVVAAAERRLSVP